MKHYCQLLVIFTLIGLNRVEGVRYEDERSDIFRKFRDVTDRVTNLEESKFKNEEEIATLKRTVSKKEEQINELLNKEKLNEETIELLCTQGREFSVNKNPKSKSL